MIYRGDQSQTQGTTHQQETWTELCGADIAARSWFCDAGRVIASIIDEGVKSGVYERQSFVFGPREACGEFVDLLHLVDAGVFSVEGRDLSRRLSSITTGQFVV